MQKTSAIYAIVNEVNGHLYVGSAVDIQKRWRQHRHNLRSGQHHSSHLQRAWDKYGEMTFQLALIAEYPPSSLIQWEQYWIDELQPEYNICPTAGNQLGTKHTPEARARIAAAHIGRKHTREARAHMSAAEMGNQRSLGCKRSPETRAKISAALTGRRHTPEARAKMSAVALGNKRCLGRKYSSGTRAKISMALKRAGQKRKEILLFP